MLSRARSSRPHLLLAFLLAATLVLAACTGADDEVQSAGAQASGSPAADEGSPGEGAGLETIGPEDDVDPDDPDSYTVDPPGPLKSRMLRPDLLITGKRPLPEKVVERIRDIKGIQAAVPISVAAVSIEGRTLNVASGDLTQLRRFTPGPTAQADFVWERVAGGEVAVDNAVPRKLMDKRDMIDLGSAEDAPTVHVGAFAPLVSQVTGPGESRPAIHAMVNTARGAQLGLPEENGLLVSTGKFTPSTLEDPVKNILGDRATVQILALELDLGTTQTAVLSNVSVSEAIGTFSYTNKANGEIDPDPTWVRNYIRTESVPILGKVTCNKAMLPQLRGALRDVVLQGLKDKIHPDEYAGCYYPRYIGRDPSNGLSLHSWGIAVDLNVPGNLRGTKGEIDRRVVAIFKNWGFAWGGDWNYTDPMHFEMSKVVRAR